MPPRQPDRRRTGRRRPAFEGWYYKVSDAEGHRAMATIVGLSRGPDPAEDHAFIQIIRSEGPPPEYHRFPLDTFRTAPDRFHLRLGGNTFHAEGFDLLLPGLEAHARLHDRVLWRPTPLAPGIMGPLSYLPLLECYHDLVCADAAVTGSWHDATGRHSLDGGRGYVEKDQGRSFPQAWIWTQTNLFQRRHASFMLAVATVPWLGLPFRGFLGFLLLDRDLKPFATWTGASLTILSADEGRFHIRIRSGPHTIEAEGRSDKNQPLLAPVDSGMHRTIHEGLSGTVHLRVLDRHGRLLLEDTGRLAGLETVNPHLLTGYAA